MENRYLLPSEAGRLLKCTGQNVVKLSDSGKLKIAFRTPSGVRLFAEHDVRELAERRKQKNEKRS